MRKVVVSLASVQLLDAVGLGLLLPILPFWIQEYGASAIEVTQLVALYALMTMLVSPLMGRLSDRVGRKVVVVCATLGSAGAYVGFVFADELLGIFLLRAITGAFAAKGIVVSAWLVDLVPEGDRGRYLGLLGSMNGVGMLIGPLLASVLLQFSAEGSFNVVFFCTAAFSVLAGCALMIVPEKKNIQVAGSDSKALASDDSHVDLLALNFFIFLGFSVIFSTSAIYMHSMFSWNASEAGLGIGLMTGCVAASRAWLAHRLLAWVGNKEATLATAVCMGIALWGAVVLPDAVSFLALYCLAAVSYAVCAIGCTVLMTDRVEATQRGKGLGWLGASASAGIVVGASTHGYLFEISPALPFQIYGCLLACCALVLFAVHFHMMRRVGF